MDGIWSFNGWPYYSPSSSKLSALAPPFSGSFSNLLRDSDPEKPNNSPGYSGFQFMDPLSTELPRISYPGFPPIDWSSLSHYNTESSEIKDSGQRPGSWNQVLKLNKGKNKQVELGASFCSEEPNIFGGAFRVRSASQGYVKGPNNDGALDPNNFSNIKEAFPMSISESPVSSDSGQFHSHLHFEPTSPNNAMLSDWNVPRDVVDYVLKARPRIPNSQANLDIEKSSDGEDECNPAVDSPCWNGAPAAPFSLSEASLPELMKEFDECLGSNLEGPKDFVVETENHGTVSFEISNRNQMQNEIDCQEKGLSVSNFASQEYNSDGVVNDGPSNAAKQVTEETKFMSQSQNPLCCCTDVGFNVNECLECCISQEAEHGLSSHSFILGAPKKVSAPKIDMQMLIKMMHNVSELLLSHCLTDEFELNEQDRSVLENVISNLRTCTLKNAEQVIPAQKHLFPESDSGDIALEPPELQQIACVEGPHLSKVGAERAKVDLENLPVKDKKNHHFMFGKEHGAILDSPCISLDDTETKKVDKMTKAIKRILCENFHEEEEPETQTQIYKNLWLEAEAALCSFNYRARYDRMIEMEKYKQRDKGEQSKTEADLKLSPSHNSAIKVNSSDSADEHISVFHAANLTEQSFLNCSPYLNEPIASQPEGERSQNVGSFTQESAVFRTNEEAEGYEASVLARFHVLMSQDEQSCINTVNPEDQTNSGDPGARDIALELVSGGTDSPKTQNQDTNPETLDNLNTAVNGSVLKEYYLEDLEYNQEVQPGSSHKFGHQFVTDYSDGWSSDWELV